ncbi:MAG: ribonuclease E/G, partial [Parvularculaceae bacterium]|nr:ribonuclease E/G [Parvularculaceae bacterium]
KSQEVIKVRQIMLGQVVKEERGNKGAALTTYLSLAGRYCVLMPNTARGGGISRKIPVAADRKRLRRVVDGLDVPDGMGLIIRTAGAKRTKAEIKRDYEYLVRLWENIRALTLKSIAPSLIYEEANLIKRAIRDLYDKDIKKVLVEGDAGYREAKDFMKMLMPSHAKNVQPYKETAPLFLRYNVESQLDAMYQPSVRLKSGGYIVINQTEALIAIDVNSGKATRERNIEQTALRTNLEAADEAARQCRMRDLAGLIVIDFIDMDEQRNNRAVERRLKDALKNDRARIQLGRISNFGLLEMSRQRRRSGIVDGTTHACPTCGGAGAVRSQEMAALRILRAVEGEAISSKAGHLQVRAALDVALYVLNHKRDWLARISNDYGVTVEITADSSKAGDQYEVEKTGVRKENYERPAAVRADSTDSVEIETDTADDEIAARDADDEKADADGESRRGKRRRRRKRKDAQPAKSADDTDAGETEAGDGEQPEVSEAAQGDDENGKSKKRRRRGRRGGRRSKRDQEAADADAKDESAQDTEQPAYETPDGNDAMKSVDAVAETGTEAGPEMAATNEATPETEAGPAMEPDAPATPEPAPQAAAAEPEPVEIVDQSPDEPKGPPKKGWWQRAVGG